MATVAKRKEVSLTMMVVGKDVCVLGQFFFVIEISMRRACRKAEKM